MKGKRKASANSKLLPSNGVDDQAIEIAANREEEEEEERNRDKVEDVKKNEEDVDNGEEGEEGEEEEEEEEAEADERPKLDEGFYEIEAIRQKRVRKGQVQYFIKWRGWPETANTWEPKENLQSCSDVIEAFEERLGSGKGSRKRKRKHGSSTSQGKKKQQRGSSENNATGDEVSVADRSVPSTSMNTSSLASPPAHFHEEGDDGNGANGELLAQIGDNGCTSRPGGGLGNKDDGEYDPKLSELRGSATSNDLNGDKIAFQFPDATNAPEVQNGFPTVDSADPAQNSRRTGSRRRKSSSVKRFKEDPTACDPAPLDNPLSNISFSCSSGYKTEDQITDSPIIKILKPISFSASQDTIQNVVVTFLAMRSDGKEVIVDNKFLKTHNPLLLINYYEKHLKYST